jgi:hypoxia up-regulated 1
MKVDVYGENEEAGYREHLASFVINGIDEVATNEIAKKEGSTKPKVSLSFELTRSGLIQLNKAEAKIEETYVVEEKPPKKKKVKKEEAKDAESETAEKTENTEETTTEDKAEEKTETDEPEVEEVKKVTKKRPHNFPLGNIGKEFKGQPTLTKEQIKSAKDRMRWFDKRDEDKIKTDKAKNDFESVIYAMRDWLNEDENNPFIP